MTVVLAAGAWWLATDQPGPAVTVTPTASITSTANALAAGDAAPHSLALTPTPTPFLAVVTAPAVEADTSASTLRYFPVVVVPPPTPTPGPIDPPAGGDWRAYLAYYRAVARLPALLENAAWSNGAFQHARYLVENDVNTSGEDPGLAWYTSEGAATGPESLWQLRGEANWNDVLTFDHWMRWPFHALSIIDPALHSYGYGRYSEPGADPGPFHTGAVLDVRRGLGPPNAAYPVMWPSHNTGVYLTSYDGGEQPDPLTSCSGIGLNGPAGLPVLLQIGAGQVIGPSSPQPVVSFSSFQENGVEREHCVFDETSYHNSIASRRDEGRALLAARDAIVLIPRVPLIAGRAYTVTITALGTTYIWTFRVVNKP